LESSAILGLALVFELVLEGPEGNFPFLVIHDSDRVREHIAGRNWPRLFVAAFEIAAHNVLREFLTGFSIPARRLEGEGEDDRFMLDELDTAAHVSSLSRLSLQNDTKA
jgi:hypothetical protein